MIPSDGDARLINVALVGFGFAGRVFHAPLIAAVDGLRLHTVVSSQDVLVRARWPEVRVVPDLASVLADPDVALVVLATPNAVHAEQAHAALDAGKHVVVDKPFTVTLEDAESVAAHSARRGRVLSVFHNRRWDSDFLTLRRLIGEGTLGDVTYFESRFDRFRPVVRDRWRERAGAGAGLWYDLGPHLVDQALQLFGAPLGVSADLAIQREGAAVDDYFHVVLRYELRRVVLHASTLVAANDLRFAVHGTRGSFVKHGLDAQEEALKAGAAPGGAGWGEDARPGVLTVVAGETSSAHDVPGVPGDWRRFYDGVREAIAVGGVNPVPALEAVAVMRVLEAGVASARERREVVVGR